MKMMLYHLSGSLRGRTQYLDTDFIRFGIGDSCGIVFDASTDAMVCPVHAELAIEDQTPVIRDRSGRNALFVNGQPCAESPLKDGDLLQFGQDGPLVRFRLMPEEAPPTKPFRHIVADSRDIVVRTPHARYMSPLYLARHVLADVARYGSPVVKLSAATLVLAPLVIIAVLVVSLYRHHLAAKASERRMTELVSQLETGRLTRVELEQRIEQERRSVTELERQREELVAKLSAAVREQEAARRTRAEMETVRRQLGELESAQRFAEDIVRRFERGVGFLQGGYGFREKDSGRPLRYGGFDERGNPLLDEKGNTLVTVEGTAPPVVIYYAGTGFLVDARGTVLTNRHLVRMWESYEPAQEALQAGYEPDLRVLRIFFPAAEEPYDLDVVEVSDRMDLVVLRTSRAPPGGTPLPLAPMEEAVREGEPVVVLSYPGTFDGMLARLSKPVSDELMQAVGTDAMKLAEILAQRRLIRPLVTQGHVSGVSPDVIAFEAASAGGSSGGPVLDRTGRVIAVNQAVLRRVGGVNVGLPVRFVWELLGRAGVALSR